MPARPPSFAAVRALARALPHVETGTVYGSPALKTRGRMFACLAIHPSAERRSLVIRLPFATRDRLMSRDPEIFYVTPHYVGYPCVLVRLARVTRSELRELLNTAWAFVSDKRQKLTRRRRRRAPRSVR